jgi:DNA-binding transcriptional LysR family regulator
MKSPLDGFDPAGLHALHVLLEERHVTRAARRLGLTQSSMSHRLQRLRETFDDPLIVRVKGAMVLTPRAEAMAAPLADAMRALHAAVAAPERFDPATSRRTFSLAMPDLMAPLVPAILAELTAGAPHVDLQVLNAPPALDEALASGTPSLALAAVRDAQPGIVRRSLGDVRFGVTARRGHPCLTGALTVERWLSYGHVVVRLGNQSANLVAAAITRRKLTRRVGVEVPSFLAGLFVVAGSDLLMNAPLPLVHEVSDTLGLAVREAPVALPKVPAALLWHERFQHDPAHRWARERIYAAVRRSLAT